MKKVKITFLIMAVDEINHLIKWSKPFWMWTTFHLKIFLHLTRFGTCPKHSHVALRGHFNMTFGNECFLFFPKKDGNDELWSLFTFQFSDELKPPWMNDLHLISLGCLLWLFDSAWFLRHITTISCLSLTAVEMLSDLIIQCFSKRKTKARK